MQKKFNLFRFFDKIGVVVFTFIFLNSLRHFSMGDYGWENIIFLCIGLGGLLVDGFLVFFYEE